MKYGVGGGATSAISYSEIFKDAISVANDSYTASTIKTTPSNVWKNRPPIAISYSLADVAFPPLASAKPSAAATPSTASETFDEDTIQSAISVAIKKLEDQHRAELAQLKLEMQSKIDEVTSQMKDLGQQVAVQTYQALVKDESPLVTKTDHAQLQHEMSLISTQLTTIINMFQTKTSTDLINPQNMITQKHSQATGADPMSPARHVKRSKPTLTPEKPPKPLDVHTQDCSVSSAASDSEESMEGCEY